MLPPKSNFPPKVFLSTEIELKINKGFDLARKFIDFGSNFCNLIQKTFFQAPSFSYSSVFSSLQGLSQMKRLQACIYKYFTCAHTFSNIQLSNEIFLLFYKEILEYFVESQKY